MDPLNPSKPTTRITVSDLLERTVVDQESDQVLLGEIVSALHERGFGLLMMILVLPNCVPIPLPPGVSTIFSLPLLIIAIQMILGYPAPKLPKFLMQKSIKRKTLSGLISVVVPKLRIVEKYLRPRFSYISSKKMERFLGVFWLLFALSIAIPIPGTHFIPGVGIFLSALGLVSVDGIALILGLLVGMAGLLLSFGILVFGMKAIFHFLPFLKHIL